VRHSIRILSRLYALFLKLYPRTYWVEYGEELQTVFNLAVSEAAKRGGFSLVWMSLREVRALPGAIILEHWQERREQRMTTERGPLFTFEPGSWPEAVAALAPFMLLGVLPTTLSLLRPYTIATAPKWSADAITLGSLGLFLGLFVIGVIKGLPRWFLPNTRLPLAVFSVYGFFELLSGVRRALVLRRDPWVVRQIAYQGQL
jgi:hypothetical protein